MKEKKVGSYMIFHLFLEKQHVPAKLDHDYQEICPNTCTIIKIVSHQRIKTFIH